MSERTTFETVDPNGNRVTLVQLQDMIDVTPAGSREREYVPGSKRVRLSSGAAVNFIDDNTFEVVSTGVRLRRA